MCFDREIGTSEWDSDLRVGDFRVTSPTVTRAVTYLNRLRDGLVP